MTVADLTTTSVELHPVQSLDNTAQKGLLLGLELGTLPTSGVCSQLLPEGQVLQGKSPATLQGGRHRPDQQEQEKQLLH